MSDAVEIIPVVPSMWDDLEGFLQSGRWSRQCWCMVWRATGDEAKNNDRDFRRSCMERRVKSGETVGLLAYCDDEPVGWCSIAPRPHHRELGGPRDYQDDPNAVWSLTCFSIAKSHRKTGLSGDLLEAAIEYARKNGAQVVEAYPVEPDSPSYQYMGLVPQFERRGFVYVADAGKRRRVHRLQV